MQNVMGVINLSEENGCLDLNELTRHRCIASVPFGGRYRIIDFVLSNMVNSDIYNVGVITLDKYRSLIDHMGSGKEWDLHRKRDGLFILPPKRHYELEIPRGSIQYLYDHIDYLEKSHHHTAIVTGGNMICNINYREAVSFHQEMKGDITVFYKEINTRQEDPTRFKKVMVNDDDARIEAIEAEPGDLASNRIFMNIFILDKKLFLDLIASSYSQEHVPGHNFIQYGIMANLTKLKIYGFPHRGYLAAIDTLSDYYRYSMDLLRPGISRELFFNPGYIYTKSNDEPPTKYGDGAVVQNALIANGCFIEGTVKNSILFRGVRVHKGASVRNSIILQQCDIQSNAVLDTVIMDKEAIISEGKELKGNKEEPLIVGKRARV